MASIFFASPPRANRPVFSLSPLHQLQIRTLLLRLLPAELVLPILTQAECFQVLVSSRTERVTVVGKREGRRERYLVSKAVPLGGRIEGWKVFVSGRDGGERRELGSHRNSHSFYEAYLLRGKEEVDGSRRVMFENLKGFPKEIVQVTTTKREASGSEAEESPFVRLVKGGDRLAVDVVADEEGCLNVVESARIGLSVSHFNPASTRRSFSTSEAH